MAMSWIVRDARQAVRMFIRNPGFTAVVVLTLGLGIGVATSMFSIIHGVLLTPLAFPEPDELVRVYDTQPACDTCPASFPKYHDWKERNRVFAAIAGSNNVSFAMTGQGDAIQVSGVSATASLVDVFGVQPMIGRWFTEEEDQPGGPKIVVLSHGFWGQRFNADRQILGRKLLFGGEPYVVIGVMPEGFTHRRAEVFVPHQRELDPSTRGSHYLPTYARLKKGVTLERATAEMRALGETLAQEFGNNHGIDVQSYTEAIVGDVRTPLKVLLAAVFLLLLIAAANVANLLLVAGLRRRHELAIRLALGAGLKDLSRQLATESVMLALAGGAVGVLLAHFIVDLFAVLARDYLPRVGTIGIDGPVLAFTAIVSIAVGIFCSVWPIALICTKDLSTAVREGETRSGTATSRKVGSSLIVAEIALAFMLFIGAGLLVKNLVLLRSRDAGIRTDRIVSFNVAPSGLSYSSPEATLAFYRELRSRLSQLSNVESLGMTSHLPMYRFGWNGEFEIEGDAPWGPNEAPLVEYRWMYGDYLKTIGVPLVSGRMLDGRDSRDTRTVLINRTMAEKFWPGRDPLGRRFGQGEDRDTWYEVVGVIGDMRSEGLARPAPYEFYRTIEQSPLSGTMSVVIRARDDDPMALIPTARRMVAAIDPSLPVTEVQLLERVVADSVGRTRLMSALTTLFGTLAGFLATVGVYSVMAYTMRRQRREFGIRLAVGASQADVRKLVFGRGLRLALMGIAIGALGAWALGRFVAAMLHDVTPTDATVFAATAAAVIAIASLASFLPARSAARVNPIIVLREE
jgi:putative ABC transport system permease protein